MDVEKTIEFILELEARTQTRLDEVGRKLDEVARMQKKAEARADRADARMDNFDKSLNGIRKLIVTGMKMIMANERAIKDLAVAQAATEKQLKSFLASMEKGRNGRNHS